jgi:hypothetical protein
VKRKGIFSDISATILEELDVLKKIYLLVMIFRISSTAQKHNTRISNAN